MNRNTVVIRTRNGFYRFTEFIAWVIVIVTFFGFIGYILSAERGFRATMWFIAVFAMAASIVALVHERVHWKYQRYAGIATLIMGATICVLV